MESSLAVRAVPTLRVVGAGLDGLDFWWPAPLDRGVVEHVRKLQADAKEVGRRGRLPTVLYGDAEEGQLLEVQPNPAKIGPLLLTNANMAVVLNPEPLKGMPTVMIEIKARFIWQVGYMAAADAAQRVLYELAAEGSSDEQLLARVTGLDLCVDVQGWSPTMNQVVPRRFEKQADVAGAVNDQLYTRARDCNLHLGRRFTGVTIGKRSSGISAGFYNKTVELEVSGKTWFKEIWEKYGTYVEGQDVWRLEFRIKRKGITEFMKAGAIDNFSYWRDVQKHLDGLWSYLTRSWLVMRGKRSKTDRLAHAITPFWQQFVDAGERLFDQRGVATVLRRKLHQVAQRGTAAAAGYLVQLHACNQWDARNLRLTFEEDLSSILEAIRNHMRDKGWDPEERARMKYHREWIAMEHNGFVGEDLNAEEAA